ncbi:hypothetical protein HK405_011419 [Cladochytrium tenue]|nr:hypothetical protein HK405_011419 [Cladochytrium tenue]
MAAGDSDDAASGAAVVPSADGNASDAAEDSANASVRDPAAGATSTANAGPDAPVTVNATDESSDRTVEGGPDVEAAAAATATPAPKPGRKITFADSKLGLFLVGDKLIRIWSIITLCGLLVSWTAQWVAYVLPFWRGDSYHHGGFFQVCGTVDFYFNASANEGLGQLSLNLSHPHPEVCVPTQQYCDGFYDMLLDGIALAGERPAKYEGWLEEAAGAFPRILASRAFEALGTAFSMIFGTTTLMMVVLPTTSPRINNINGVIALIGIILTPWFAAIDLFISVSTWDWIGVGLYSDSHNVLAAGGQLAIGTSIFDFLVQFSFLLWGSRRLKNLYPDIFIEDKERRWRTRTGPGGDAGAEPQYDESYSSMGPILAYVPRKRVPATRP